MSTVESASIASANGSSRPGPRSAEAGAHRAASRAAANVTVTAASISASAASIEAAGSVAAVDVKRGTALCLGANERAASPAGRSGMFLVRALAGASRNVAMRLVEGLGVTDGDWSRV